MAGQLGQDYAKLKDASREAREQANTTVETVKDIEKRLGPLAKLQEMTKSTEERMATLNALAEHVLQKVKVLENQKHTVEHAVVESNRLNEMIWNMDVQIAKLNEGSRQAARTEEMIERIEKLSRDVTGQLDGATKAKEAFANEVARLDKDRTSLTEFVRNYVERLAVERKDFDAFEQRVSALQSSITQAEKGMEGLATRERSIAAMGQKVDGITKQMQDLTTQADDLQKKQSSLDALQEGLAQVDDLAKRTAWQFDSLKASRQDLDTLRKEIQEFYKSHAAAAQLRDRLIADRTALEAFLERLATFSVGVPELEAKMEAITGKLAVVDEGTQKATNLVAVADDLDRADGPAGRPAAVRGADRGAAEHAEHADRGRGQEARRPDRAARRGRGAQGALRRHRHPGHRRAAEAPGRQRPPEQAAAAHRAARGAQEPAREAAGAGPGHPARGGGSGLPGEAALRAARRRAAGWPTTPPRSRRRCRGCRRSWPVSAKIKDELLEELSRVQGRQSDVSTEMKAAEDHLKRVETAVKQLDQRRTQIAFADKRIGAFEARLGDLRQMAEEIDRKIEALGARHAVVDAVKKEVESVHEISARSRADLQHVEEHRAAVNGLRAQVDALLSNIGETETRLAAIESRKSLVDEVQLKTNLITNMLEDVRLNLETVGEQKAVIDHVMASFTRLSEMAQEAQSTLRALQTERELAERIERGIKQLRAKSGGGDEGKRSA